jgi:indolepyruvate ferredoxin oxidoreductase beta subunit
MASNVVAVALVGAGHDVKKSEVHGMAQRGGVVYSHVRFGTHVSSPLVERGTAEVIVAFEWAEALRWLPFLQPGGVVVASVDRIVPPVACADRRSWSSGYPIPDPSPLFTRAKEVRLVDARSVAAELGNAKAASSVLLGITSTALDVPVSAWEQAIGAGVPSRALDVNLAGFHAGRSMEFPDHHVAAPPAATRAPRVPPEIGITRAWCKSCDICVRFCPEACLALDAEEKVIAVAPDACTGCRLCELLCPDFAIEIRPLALAGAASGGGSG